MFGRPVGLRVAVAASALTAVMVGGIAWAAIPDSTTAVFTGCYRTNPPSQGALRVINAQAGQTCVAGETTITWNQRGIRWRGVWSSAVAYQKNDAVSYKGSSYIAIVPNTNVAPPTPTTWGLLAAVGAKGPPGPPLTKLEDLVGLPCTVSVVRGSVTLTYAVNGDAQIRCVLPPPPAPTGMTATVDSLGVSVSLSWTSLSGATTYDVVASDDGGASFFVLATTTGTSYVDFSTVPGTTRIFAARAVAPRGTSANSNQAPATMATLPQFGPIQTSCGPGVIQLTWPPFTGASVYDVRLSGTGTIRASTGSTSVTVSEPSPGPAGTLRALIVADNATGHPIGYATGQNIPPC